MKKLSLSLLLFFLFGVTFGQVFENEQEQGQAQDTTSAATVMDPIRAPIDGTYKKIHLPQYKPLGLVDPREADVLWSSLIWRVLDLREKLNHPLYYPKEKNGNWKSFMATILDASTDTTEANIKPLMIYDDEFLTTPKSYENLRTAMGDTKVQTLFNEWGEDTGTQVLFIQFASSDVFRIRIKEQWRLDKQRSVVDQRIINLCPMYWFESVDQEYVEEENDNQDPDFIPLPPRRWRPYGFIYYNEARELLATTEVFNPKNNAQRRTYDDIFVMRRFASFIEAEENVADNRKIYEYTVNALDQALEAERIKERIRVLEHDMWEF